MSVRFITGDDKGWLMVRRVSDNEVVSLPHMLKVEFRHTAQNRDFFRAHEGTYKGVEFSVALRSTGGSYLASQGRHLAAGTVRFNRGMNQLWFGGMRLIRAITDPMNRIPLGTFDLEIPDHPHGLASGYLHDSKHALVWFRILPGGANTSTDRYLHTGERTAGCVTVQEVRRWTAIFNYLINQRKNDVAVGTITVIE